LKEPLRPSLTEDETSIPILSPLGDPVGKGAEQETRDSSRRVFPVRPGISVPEAQELLRGPVHGPESPGSMPRGTSFCFRHCRRRSILPPRSDPSWCTVKPEDSPRRMSRSERRAARSAPRRAIRVQQPFATAARAGDGAASGPSSARPESPSPQGQGRLNP